MRRKSMFIVAAGIVTLGTCAIAATKLHSDPNATADAPTEEPRLGEIKPVNVETATVVPGRLVEQIKARGVTAAAQDVTLSAEIPGRISYLGPEVGDPVRQGQVLARIDLTSLRAQRRQAAASVELARATHGRLSDLGADIVTAQKLDEARYGSSGARAQLAAIDADLRKGVVRAGLDGVVAARHVDRAEFVGPGTPLFRLVDHRTIVVEAQLAETQVAAVRAGAEVEVHVGALDERFVGEVATIVPAADPVSHTFTVRVEVDNPDRRILVGMAAELRIATRVRDDALLVVQDTVVENAAGRGVFVVEDGVARYREVTLGATAGERVEVESGLAPGAELVVLGQRYLSDGQPVRIVTE